MSTRYILAGVSIFATVILLAACTGNKPYETAMCALADTSGTYADQKENVARIIKAGVVSQMLPGDSLYFITIDSNSYSQDNLLDKLKLDYVPSHADRERLAFANDLDRFAQDNSRSEFTDISGAMMLCSDYLKSSGSGHKVMLVFSDMKEELKSGLQRKFDSNQFDGIHVAAMNVIKLTGDSVDPAEYRDRLSQWQQRLTAAGAASWDVIVNPVDIPEYLDKQR